MKKHLLALALLLIPLSGMADDSMQQYVPSNWGGWQNLSLGTTDITYYTSDQLPMDVQVSGKTIHVAWTDWKPNAAGEYCLWYRRSTDAGKTWEEPRAVVKSTTMNMTDINYVGGNFGTNAKWMEVEGQDVYFVTIIKSVTSDEVEQSQLLYTYSHDGGATFQQRVLAESSQEEGFYKYRTFPYGRPHVEADGQTVVIAFQYSNNGYKTRVLTSFDGGQTFNNKLIDTTQELVDLKVSGRQWAVLGNDMYWYYNMHWGNVYVSTSTDGGETITTQNVAPLVKDETSWCSLEYMKGFNGASFNYHAQMTLEGDIINVIFRGCAEDLGDPHPTNDRAHTIFRRSTDFGKTWTKAMYLPESKGTGGAIAAKGDNIYVLQTPYGPLMYHSHDGGKTWEMQQRTFWNSQYSNHSNFYDLYLAPDDPKGEHVYLTTCRGLLVESKDGFRTVHRNLALGYESWYGGRSNNYSLTVRLDSEGTEHWLMNYQAPYKPFDPYFWSIVYRRNDPAPATTGQEMALDISVPETRILNNPLNKVTIPMTPSIMETREAMTVECWVRIDKQGGGQNSIASLTNSNAYHGSGTGSRSWGGWYIQSYYDSKYGYSFYAGLSTDLSVDGWGKEAWDQWRYRITETGTWHHLALTYDSRVEKDNIRFYIDGLLLGTNTERGPIAMGNNPIVIGPTSFSDWEVNETYVDNFALYSRALTHEEIMQHIYSRPDAKDKDCRLLLTFDGSLQDQSQYHNDPAPLMPNYLKEHDGIRPPHPEFTLTKDLTGKNVYLTDVTKDGQAYQWIKPDPWNLDRADKYSTSKKRHEQQDVSGHPGLYNYWMIAKGDGLTTNAYVATQQSLLVGGLSKVLPAEAAQEKGVRLRIQGGYELTYNKQPKVVLKQGDKEIEGEWLIEYGYTNKNVQSADQLPEALFDLSTAPTGLYDVIIGTDTLSQAFTLKAGGEEPEVWMQVNGRGASLWNKWQRYTIDYGNTANVAAYNVPIILCIPDRHGTVDVSFDFPFNVCDISIDNIYQQMTGKPGDYFMAYDEQTQDSIRVYSFMIPYINPNSTEQRSFRIKMKQSDKEPSDEIQMSYGIEQPWGPYDPEVVAKTRAPYTLEQGECFAKEWGKAVFETAISFVPGASCVYSIGKAGYKSYNDGFWNSFLGNTWDVLMNCASEVVPAPLKGAYKLASTAWDYYGKYESLRDMKGCLNGDPKAIGNKGRGSYDPNEMIGPWGADEERHFIKPIHQMGYTVTFENKASATAPAHEVFVTDTLDAAKYDLSTFSFTGYGWADTTLVVGAKTQEFARDVQYKVNGQDIIVRVSGQFDPQTGIARWSFISLQKNGNEIDDPDLGFLIPNNDSHAGEGFVTFIVEHKPTPANGATVSNKATIIFDANDPIVTNTYVNTFDTDYPTSKITKAEPNGNSLVLTLSGSDATSGIGGYNIYVFRNGGEAELLASGVTGDSYTMTGYDPSVSYAFCSIALDRVGWPEPKDVKPELEVAATAISGIKTAAGEAWTIYAADGTKVAEGAAACPRCSHPVSTSCRAATRQERS